MVAQLLRGHGGRRTGRHVETVHREPEQARVIPHRPEGRRTLNAERWHSQRWCQNSRNGVQILNLVSRILRKVSEF